MIRAFYTATSGMIYENKRQENISQNFSNVETSGFKQTLLVAAAQQEATVVNQNGRNEVGSLTMKVGIDEAYLDFSQGQLKVTDQPYDFAITGEGFFVLEGPNNEPLYTRDGSFGVDEQGRLVSKEGYPVLTTGGGYIVVNDEDLNSSSNGNLLVGNRNYQMMVANLDNANLMTATGNNAFTYAGNPDNVGAEFYTVTQGAIEGSNVDPTEEMINMISSSRSFQMNSKVLQAMDQVLQQSVNEIGKI